MIFLILVKLVENMSGYIMKIGTENKLLKTNLPRLPGKRLKPTIRKTDKLHVH